MSNPGFTWASANPEDHPHLTFIPPQSPEPQLPTGCPPLDPALIADSTVTVTPQSDEPPVAELSGEMLVIAPEDMPEAVVVEPEGA